jgi:uncharacterized membrane protein (UPF0127 family)
MSFWIKKTLFFLDFVFFLFQAIRADNKIKGLHKWAKPFPD